MSTSTSRRTGAGKILALITSLTLILAGFAGIALAGPAAADGSVDNDYHKVWICHAVEGKGETGQGYNRIEVDQSAWDGTDTEHPSDHRSHAGDKAATYNGTGDKTKKSSYSCGESTPQCEEGQELQEGECVVIPDPCPSTDQSDELSYKDGEKDECVDPCDEQTASVTYKDGEEDGEDSDSCEPDCTDGQVWNATAEQCQWFGSNDEGYASLEICYDGETQTVDAYGEGSAWSTVSQEAADAAAELAANADASDNLADLLDESYAGYSEGECTVPPTPDFCAENPTAPSCTPAPTCENNPAACPPSDTPVVTPATVAAPAPALVEVSAPAPATVAAPAPATVAVPAAATLPASVPAGNGSKAPALPLWALALVAVGIIGAAATGVRFLGANK